MNKVFVVAWNEYLIAVTSKAFLIGIIMMPVFMGGAIVVQYLTRDQIDLTPRKIAIVDRSGRVFESLAQQAEIRNSQQIYEGEGDARRQTQAEFIIENVPDSARSMPDSSTNENDSSDLPPKELDGNDSSRIDAQLSDRVRRGELFAFAIIDQDIFEVNGSGAIHYYSQSPSYQTLANWLEVAVNQVVKQSRIEALQIPPESVAAITKQTQLRQFGLVQQRSDGQVEDAKEENRLLTFVVPFTGLFLMFMMIMSVAPAMLNNVLEEKIQKISEFLVSSITPFQLMLGKLLGAVAVGLTLSAIYLGAVFWLAQYYEIADSVPITLYAWFIFYLIVALVIFGSIFSAIGAACSEIRDAQSLMTPAILLVIIPLMCIGPVLDSPTSTFAKLVSLFPPATPMLMFVRIALPPGPELWEIVLGTALVILFAMACVWAAGKVFRIGILSQGQAPTFAQLIWWIFSKN
jgi:ABC-2 type transport system permease protein